MCSEISRRVVKDVFPLGKDFIPADLILAWSGLSALDINMVNEQRFSMHLFLTSEPGVVFF